MGLYGVLLTENIWQVNLRRSLGADKISTGLLFLVSSAVTPGFIITGEERSAGLTP